MAILRVADTLSDWADKWQYLFNLEKCEVMRVVGTDLSQATL